MKENDFMRRIREIHGEYNTFRVYRALKVEDYKRNDLICKMGSQGDHFYIILQGDVGVLQPSLHEESYTNYFELYEFMNKNDKFLLRENIEDSHSSLVQCFMDLVPQVERRRLNFQSMEDLSIFVSEMV